MRYEPNRRPTLEQLLQRIRRYTAYEADEDGSGSSEDGSSHDPNLMKWEDSSGSDGDADPDDLVDGMRAFDPAGDVEDPHPLLHLEGRLNRSFPIGNTIIAGGVGLPTSGMGWHLLGD